MSLCKQLKDGGYGLMHCHGHATHALRQAGHPDKPLCTWCARDVEARIAKVVRLDGAAQVSGVAGGER